GDWSSDVCSSDLILNAVGLLNRPPVSLSWLLALRARPTRSKRRWDSRRTRSGGRGASNTRQDGLGTGKGGVHLNAMIGNPKLANRWIIAALPHLHDRDEPVEL